MKSLRLELLAVKYWLLACLWVTAMALGFGLATTSSLALEAYWSNTLGFFLLFLSGLGVCYGCCIAYRHLMQASSHFLLLVSVSLILLTIIAYNFGHLLPGVPSRYPPIILVILTSISGIPLLGIMAYYHCLIETTQISALYHQIRLHFLFNTLNTAVCLISSHPRDAENTLLGLTSLYRLMLRQEPFVKLYEEINVAKDYIRIERIRLGARLGVKWKIPALSTLQTQVPVLLLQPLVENAIYHGIETNAQGGIVTITITEEERFIFFEISNSVDASAGQSKGGHIAQDNIRRRLLHVYGSECGFSSNHNSSQYCVKFSVPRRRNR